MILPKFYWRERLSNWVCKVKTLKSTYICHLSQEKHMILKANVEGIFENVLSVCSKDEG
jgi:hypothetical protein